MDVNWGPREVVPPPPRASFGRWAALIEAQSLRPACAFARSTRSLAHFALAKPGVARASHLPVPCMCTPRPFNCTPHEETPRPQLATVPRPPRSIARSPRAYAHPPKPRTCAIARFDRACARLSTGRPEAPRLPADGHRALAHPCRSLARATESIARAIAHPHRSIAHAQNNKRQ